MKAISTLALTLAAVALLGLGSACDSSTGGTTNSYCDSPAPKTDSQGKIAGAPCEKDDECQSNKCATELATSPTVKVCIRSCSSACGLPITCSSLALPNEGISYTPLIYGDPVSGQQLCHCVPACGSATQCEKVSSKYSSCAIPKIPDLGTVGASSACIISATGGGPDGGGSDGSVGTDGDATGSSDGDAEPVNSAAGCSKTEEAPYPDGLLPGSPCEQDSDCIHGFCGQDSPNITGGTFKVCIKRCSGCPNGSSPACPDDDGLSGLYFTCVKPTGSMGKVDHCGVRCDSASGLGGLEGCKTISPDYTSCNDNNAGKKYCGAQ